VILIRDFETGNPAYEIYTFNRQVVTVPVGEGTGRENTESWVEGLARQEVEREIRSIARGHVDVEFKSGDRAVVYVDESDISAVIGTGGGRIDDIENQLGIDIDVRTHDERPDAGGGPGRSGGSGASGGGPASGDVVTPEVTGQHVIVPVDGHVGETVEVQADGEYLFTATVGRGGEIQVSRGSANAEELEDAIDRRRQISIVPA
jgi:ATPase